MASPSSIIPVQDLPTIPPSAQGYLITVDPAMDKAGKSVIPDIQAAAAVVTQQIGSMLSTAEKQVTMLVNDANAQLSADIADINADFQEQLAATVSDASIVLAGLGYLVPVPFQFGISVNSARITVSNGGFVYAANPTSIPFTTGTTFDPSQWRLVQGVTALDLSQGQGSSLVGFTQVGTNPKIQQLQEKIRNLEVSANDFAGVVGNGVNDDTAGLQNAFNTRRRVVLQRGATYKVSSTLSAANGVQAYFEEGASIVGPGGIVLFSAASAGIISITGRGYVTGFSKLVDFSPSASIDLLQIKEITFQGTSNPSASASGCLVSYFASDVHIKNIEVKDNTVLNGREGILFRGTWDFAVVSGNKMTGVQHYSIRLGQDLDPSIYNFQRSAVVCNNYIKDMYNPITGSGSNECNAISIFGRSGHIYGNYVENINGAGVDDIEGIYTKLQHGSIFSNTLVDACRREGAICIKSGPSQPGGDYTQNNMVEVFGNSVFFTLNRSHECSISIQASNVNVFGNYVQSGAGITSESAAIVVKYRSAYQNISIHGNSIACYGSPGAYGILLWAYGKNVRVFGNNIFGSANHAIRLETRASTDVRHPGEGNQIGQDYSVESNYIVSTPVGASAGMARGIGLSINSGSPVTNYHQINNKISGPFSEYRQTVSATGSSRWFFEGNDYAGATGPFLWSAMPAALRIKNNSGLPTTAKGVTQLSSGNATVTVTNGISSSLASYITTTDISLSPLNAGFYERRIFPSTIFGSGNFQVDAGAVGGAASFRWQCSIEDRDLT